MAWVAALSILMTVAAGLQFFTRRQIVSLAPLTIYATTALAVLLLGGTRVAGRHALPPYHVAGAVSGNGRAVVLEGRIEDEPESRTYGLRFTLSTRIVVDEKIHATTGRILVTWIRPNGIPRSTLRLGEVVRLRGYLRAPPRRRNPADFNYRRYLKRKGIYATLTVKDSEAITVLGNERNPIERFISQSRRYVQTMLTRYVPSASGVLRALLLGDRSHLTPEVLSRFAGTGLMHLLAVSGLHVLLVGMVLYGLLRPLLMRLRQFGLALSWEVVEYIRSAVTLAVLLFYMLLTGASPSVVRAVIMTALLMGQVLFQRNAHTLNTLGVAAFLILIIDPENLFDVGFQLSFAAVGGIVSLHPVITRNCPPSWRSAGPIYSVVTTVSVSLAATLGTMPILLSHFGRVPFAGLVLNIVAIPLTALTLIAGILLIVFGWVSPIGSIIGGAADGFARVLLLVADAGSKYFDWATIELPLHSTWLILAMVSAIILIAQWPRPRIRWRLGMAALIFLGIPLWTGVLTGAFLPYLDVIFFDVGQGDAALISTPNGKHILIDAGPRSAYVDQGRRTLLPHFQYDAIRRIDAVIITHPHSDHLGGLPTVLRTIPVSRVLDNGQKHLSTLFDETSRLVDSLKIKHQTLQSGDTLALDPSVKIEVLSPRSLPAEDDDANESSVVLRLVYGKTCLLFMGDAGERTETRLVSTIASRLVCDAIKVGHHGSETSSTIGFVRQVRADTTRKTDAVISVGRENPFGLPDSLVLERWRIFGATVLTTRDEGAIHLRSDGNHLYRLSWR